VNLDARSPGLETIGNWRCGDTGVVRYAEHRVHSEWRFSIGKGGTLYAGYGGVTLPAEVFTWLIRPIVDSATPKVGVKP
jgi:hypothetical protein